MPALSGLKVAVIVEQGFEQSELLEPRKALEDAGAEVDVISPVQGRVTGWSDEQWGDEVSVDLPLTQAHPREYDALLLAGGLINPDRLRTNERAVQFIRTFNTLRRPIAAICHAAWMLIEADIVRGKRLTSALDQDRSQERRCHLGRQRRRRRSRPRHLAKDRRHSGLHSQDDRGVCRRSRIAVQRVAERSLSLLSSASPSPL